MDGEAHDERAGPGRAGPRFDTMANLRALGEVQRRGLEAANDVIERLLDQMDRTGPQFGAESPASTRNPFDPTEMAGQFTAFMNALLGGMVQPNGNGRAPGQDAQTPSSGITADPLTIDPVPSGGTAHGELWLHNRSGVAVADVRLHCGDLRAHDGWAISSDHIAFDPPHLDELPDRTSRGISIEIAVPEDAPPETYRGVVLASNMPGVWLPVEFTVGPTP